MTGQVKVSTHTVVDFFLCDRSEVFAHSITQGSFAVANILFTTFFALYTVYNVVGFTAATSDGVVAVFGNRASNSPRAVEAETVSAVLSLTPAFLQCVFNGFSKTTSMGLEHLALTRLSLTFLGLRKPWVTFHLRTVRVLLEPSKMSQFCWMILFSNLPPYSLINGRYPFCSRVDWANMVLPKNRPKCPGRELNQRPTDY